VAPPRFLFVALHGAPGDSAVIVPAQSRGSEPSYGWRLLGSNNRELGRSASALVTLDDVVDDVELLRRDLDLMELTSTRGPANGGWTWSLDRESGPAARSARAFHRERECRYSAEQFLAGVPAAEWALPSEQRSLPVVSARAFSSQSLVIHPPVRASR
jgi:hypothetical protein